MNLLTLSCKNINTFLPRFPPPPVQSVGWRGAQVQEHQGTILSKCLVQRYFLFHAGMRLFDVNGCLTSLSEHKGFRNFVKTTADNIGVTGIIQRYHRQDVLIDFEGTDSQVRGFQRFLRECEDQEMVHSIPCTETTKPLL